MKHFPVKFWLLNAVNMLERLAWMVLVLELAVYIAQKDVPGGLHWSHEIKGYIFMMWALLQNLSPIITGGMADRFGRKKMIVIAIAVMAAGYLLLGTQRELLPFVLGAVVFGIGGGMFKPAIQGMLASTMTKENESIGWGTNVMLINFAVMFGPPLAKYLESFSWEIVFIGCAAIISLSYTIIFFISDPRDYRVENINLTRFAGNLFRDLSRKRVIAFVLLMSGFWMVYLQFYETLPNFLYDWTDSSGMAESLFLPDFMTMKTALGTMVDYKWLYLINSVLVVLFVVPLSYRLRKVKIQNSLLAGISLATAGMAISGATMYGVVTALGMVVYTFGEMITNPKFTQYMSRLGGLKNKSQYLGYLNISLAIGFAGGSWLGGIIYHWMGEKSGFAVKHLENYFGISAENNSEAFTRLMEATGFDAGGTTQLLWELYHPQLLWLPFVGIALVSIVGLYFYFRQFSD